MVGIHQALIILQLVVKMKLSELKIGQGKVDIEASVKNKGEVRVMNKYGKELKVANATIEDDSGEMTLTLWNADADNVNIGDKIKITNGYVSEFNGTKQLTSGKFGKLEIIGKPAESSEASEVEKAPETEKTSKTKKSKKSEEIDENAF